MMVKNVRFRIITYYFSTETNDFKQVKTYDFSQKRTMFEYIGKNDQDVRWLTLLERKRTMLTLIEQKRTMRLSIKLMIKATDHEGV